MKKILIWLIALLFLTSLACNLPFEIGGGIEPNESLPDFEDNSFKAEISDEGLLKPVDLSGAQRQVLAVYGLPNRFMITFASEMREETWYYDIDGYNVTFRNGEIYTESQGEPVLGELLLSSDYTPWLFSSKMSLSELLAITGSESFAIERLDEVFQEEVSLVTLAGLNAGFRGGKLLFVRAVPMRLSQRTADGEASDGQPSVEPPVGDTLAAPAQIHAGTHTYRTFCTYSDGTTEDYVGPVTWAFMEDGVYFDGEGPFPWVSENFYGVSDTDGEIYIYFQENVITITGESYDLDAQGEEVLVTFACALTQE